MAEEVKRINGDTLRTGEPFRIELPSGGSWSIWPDTKVFVCPAQSGMICEAYKTSDGSRSEAADTVNLDDVYCIYVWWVDMDSDLEKPSWKEGWLNTTNTVLQTTTDTNRRSGFKFTIPGAGQISGYNSYTLQATEPVDYNGDLRDLQGCTCNYRWGKSFATIDVSQQGGVIRRRENFPVGGYWVTMY